MDKNQYLKSEINFRQGKFYVSLEKHEKALPYFIKALEIDPDHSFYLAYTGLCYYTKKEFEKSLDYINKAILTSTDIDYPEGGYQKHLKQLRDFQESCINHLEMND